MLQQQEQQQQLKQQLQLQQPQQPQQQPRQKFNIHDFKCCIVGNAWGNSDRYKEECEDCYMMAVKFTINDSSEVRQKFFNHFNEKHQGS